MCIVVVFYVDFDVIDIVFDCVMIDRVFVFIEGVYFMGGDVVFVGEFVEIVYCYGVLVVVDDVYGIGMVGFIGCGVIEEFLVL